MLNKTYISWNEQIAMTKLFQSSQDDIVYCLTWLQY